MHASTFTCVLQRVHRDTYGDGVLLGKHRGKGLALIDSIATRTAMVQKNEGARARRERA